MNKALGQTQETLEQRIEVLLSGIQVQHRAMEYATKNPEINRLLPSTVIFDDWLQA